MPGDEFFAKKKEAFLQKLQEEGLDFYAAKDFVENRGVYSMNSTPIKQHINNPNYINPLKVVPMMMQPQQ